VCVCVHASSQSQECLVDAFKGRSVQDLSQPYLTKTLPSSPTSLTHQITTRERKARPALEAVVDKVQRVLERVCKEVNRQAKLYQESVRDQNELEDTTGVELIQVRLSGYRDVSFWVGACEITVRA